MNMEDRLREAFDQEAQHLHAPSGSPETAVRRGRRRRASNLIGGATLVLALVGGTAAGVQLLGSSEEPPADDLAGATESVQTDQTTSVDDLGLEEVAFSWNKVELPLPDNAYVWNVKVGAVDGGFVAIGRGDVTPQDGPGSGMVTWRSPDGQAWELITASEPFDGILDDVLVTEAGFVAITRSDSGSDVILHQSSDGVNWTTGNTITGLTGNDQYLWLARAASGDGATVVAGVAQAEPVNPPLEFPEFGLALEPPDRTDAFRIVDLETGAFITEVPAETFYGVFQGTLTVLDAEGEVALLVDPQLLAEAESLSEDPGDITIEQDGIRLSLDYFDNRYTAVDMASGDLVAEGDTEELYQAQQIVVAHPETGAVLLDITFEEFMEAEQRSYDDFEYRSQSSPVVLTSRDGGDWVAADLPIEEAEELDFAGLAHGDGGFVMTVGRYGREVYSQETWTSDDGQAWELVASSDQIRRAAVVGRDGEYYSLSYAGRGEGTISRSTDGVDWTPAFVADSSGFFLNEVATGGLGLAAIGQLSGANIPVEPISITKEGRTFLFDTEAGAVTVTADATGEVLLDFAFDVFSAEPPEQFQVDDETGTLTLVDEEGAVIMVITEEEGEAASSSVSEESPGEFAVPSPVVLFSEDGDEWRRASNSGLDLAWSQSVAVGDTAIVIAGESADAYADEVAILESGSESGSDSGSVVAPATTLVFEPEFAPSVFLWVGQPK